VVEEFSDRPVAAESRFRHHVSPCGICGGQIDNEMGRSPSISGFPSQNNSTNVPYLSSYSVALTGRTNGRDLRTFQTAMLFRKSVIIG
jgi:hypothetical protein